MKVLVFGHLGNMGKRYGRILTDLKADWVGIDNRQPILDKIRVCREGFKAITHVIIATPTETHQQLIRDCDELFELPVKILCEKPISFDMYIHNSPNLLYMVNNYQYLTATKTRGLTSYAYYYSGPHGIIWDCIQLIAMAHGELELSLQSTQWSAMINGHELNRSTIDASYAAMIQDFIGEGNHLWGKAMIYKAHCRCTALESRFGFNPTSLRFDYADRSLSSPISRDDSSYPEFPKHYKWDGRLLNCPP